MYEENDAALGVLELFEEHIRRGQERMMRDILGDDDDGGGDDGGSDGGDDGGDAIELSRFPRPRRSGDAPGADADQGTGADSPATAADAEETADAPAMETALDYQRIDRSRRANEGVGARKGPRKKPSETDDGLDLPDDADGVADPGGLDF